MPSLYLAFWVGKAKIRGEKNFISQWFGVLILEPNLYFLQVTESSFEIWLVKDSGEKHKLVIACIWLIQYTPSLTSTNTICKLVLLCVSFSFAYTIFHCLEVLSDRVLKSVDLFLHYFFFASKLKKLFFHRSDKYSILFSCQFLAIAF